MENGSKGMSKFKIRRLTVSSVMIALASVLSLVKIWEMPLGGSVTLLSMLPIIIIAVSYGTGWGLCSAFVYSLIQLAFGILFDGLLGWSGLTPYSLVGSMLFDYIFAYTILGIAGIFVKKGPSQKLYQIICGVIVALFGRFFFHFLSGVIFFGATIPEGWDNAWLYSIAYNGTYMLPELGLTLAASVILFGMPQIKKMMKMLAYGR